MNRREVILAGTAAAGLASCGKSANRAPTFSDRRKAFAPFAVNVESWWRDQPFEARFDLAAKAAFSHVEFWFIDSWDRKASDIAKLANDAGVAVAQIVGDSPALARPDVRAEFLENCKRAIENAKVLDTEIVTFTGHQDVEGISKQDALASYQDHMAAAAPLFEDAQVFAAIEPFNPYNHPGHFIYGHAEALRICQDVGSPFVKMNWDLFHMQRHEGNLIDNLRKGQDQICYMQLADSPDRHQPGTGEVDYDSVLRACQEIGYSRPMGLELWAKDDNYDAALDDIYALAQRVQAAPS